MSDKQYPYSPPDEELTNFVRFMRDVIAKDGSWLHVINGEMVDMRTGEIVPTQDNPNSGQGE